MKIEIPEVGAKFGRLTMVEFIGVVPTPSGRGNSAAWFRCDCGEVVKKDVSGVMRLKVCSCSRYCELLVSEIEERLVENALKPSRPGARVITARHNRDAVPSRYSTSIGSGLSMCTA